MKRTRTLIYVGPTLSADDMRELLPFLPDVTILPPAAVGDILRAAHDPTVGRIALIDGYFERMAAVWHKEILVALERGIEVWGAASMGAVRAAELHPFGMRGVGMIFDWFKRGALLNDDLIARGEQGPTSRGEKLWFTTADDEVAVAHLPAEQGYRAVSEPLINIRYNLLVMTSGNIITEGTAERLVELARARFYRERTWPTLLADARAAKLPERELVQVEKRLMTDRKRADALELIVKLMRKPSTKRGRGTRVPRTWALRQLERLIL